MALEIHMAQVGIGDCILIRMGEKERKLNFLIDSGKNESGYSDTISYITDHMETIDYMMVTHDDDDHIMGLFDSIVNKKGKMLYSLFTEHKVLMNYWKKGREALLDYKKVAEIGRDLGDQEIDLSQIEYVTADPVIESSGESLENNEKKIGFTIFQIIWQADAEGHLTSEIRKFNGTEPQFSDSQFPPVEDGWEHAELVILSPTRESLRKYVEDAWKEYRKLLDQKGKEVTFAGETADKKKKLNDWDYSIQDLYDRPMPYVEDASKANNASISFLLYYNGTVSLFAGDSRPSDMISSAQRYMARFIPETDRLPLDFMKVPHHASSKNNPFEFLNLFPTKFYLISTKGSNRYLHPGKQTLANIARVHEEDGEAFLYCNYDTWKRGDLKFRDRECTWNVKNDLCKVWTSEDEEISLHFVKLERKGINIQSGSKDKILVSV